MLWSRYALFFAFISSFFLFFFVLAKFNSNSHLLRVALEICSPMSCWQLGDVISNFRYAIRKKGKGNDVKNILITIMQNATPLFESMDILVSMLSIHIQHLHSLTLCFPFPLSILFFASLFCTDYLQQNQGNSFVYVKYATLSEYYDALQAVPNIVWPENHGNDFFPLFESLYWTVIPPSPSPSLLPLPSSYLF